MSRKSLVIIRSEFVRRVTSKMFVLTTLLAPALFMGFMAITIWISVSSIEDSIFSSDQRSHRIAIVDDTGTLGTQIIAEYSGAHTLVQTDLTSAPAEVLAGNLDGYVYLPEGVLSGAADPVLHAIDEHEFQLQIELQDLIDQSLKNNLLSQQKVDPEIRKLLSRSVRLGTEIIASEASADEDPESEEGYFLIAGVLSMIMYIAMIFYGTLIFYGTMEERTTRVVELIVSSVRPFELLLGKILGIGLVGLVQMAVWIMMVIGGLVLVGPVMSLILDPGIVDLFEQANDQELLSAASISLPGISVELFIWFLFYFLGGYLLYGGLFAIVGTMIDSPQESQTLMLPLMMPMIISLVCVSPIMMNPQSSLAVAVSLIPFTSPVPMIVRIAVGEVPLWQLILSAGLLIAAFWGSIWFSARIYRASILMYGKKVSLKRILTFCYSG